MTSPHALALQAAAVRYVIDDVFGSYRVIDTQEGEQVCWPDDKAAAQAEANDLNLAAVQAVLDERDAELRKYMRHDGLCAFIGGYGYCSCGMEAALATLTGEGDDD